LDSKLLKRLAFLSFVLVPFAACGDDDEQATTNGDTTDGGDDDDDDDDDDSDPTDASQTVTDTDPTATVTDTDPTVTVTDTDPTDPDSSSTDPTDATESSSTDPTDATESSSTDATGSSTTDTDTGSGDCTVWDITTNLIAFSGNVYRTQQADLLGDAMTNDLIQLSFYATDTGMFDLAPAPNDNFFTCDQCVLIAVDDFAGPFYFQSEGTIELDDDPTDGTFSGSFTGVRLIEVELDGDADTTTPVRDGGCIDIVDTDLTSMAPPPAPAGWTCDDAFYGSIDGCDCGCGVTDPDCFDETVESCGYCDNIGSCSESVEDCPGNIDPLDNAVCT